MAEIEHQIYHETDTSLLIMGFTNGHTHGRFNNDAEADVLDVTGVCNAVTEQPLKHDCGFRSIILIVDANMCSHCVASIRSEPPLLLPHVQTQRCSYQTTKVSSF